MQRDDRLFADISEAGFGTGWRAVQRGRSAGRRNPPAPRPIERVRRRQVVADLRTRAAALKAQQMARWDARIAEASSDMDAYSDAMESLVRALIDARGTAANDPVPFSDAARTPERDREVQAYRDAVDARLMAREPGEWELYGADLTPDAPDAPDADREVQAHRDAIEADGLIGNDLPQPLGRIALAWSAWCAERGIFGRRAALSARPSPPLDAGPSATARPPDRDGAPLPRPVAQRFLRTAVVALAASVAWRASRARPTRFPTL